MQRPAVFFSRGFFQARGQLLRWRCIRSIEAARNTAAERDAFGARQTELNRSRSLAEQERVMREYRRPDYRC